MKSTIQVSDVDENLIKTQRNTPNPDLSPNYNRPQMANEKGGQSVSGDIKNNDPRFNIQKVQTHEGSPIASHLSF